MCLFWLSIYPIPMTGGPGHTHTLAHTYSHGVICRDEHTQTYIEICMYTQIDTQGDMHRHINKHTQRDIILDAHRILKGIGTK